MELFELLGTIAVNNSVANEAIDETTEKAEQSSSKFGNFLGKVGSVATKIAGVGVAALGAVATGLGALTKQSVAAYADYEQFVGGVETLFKDSSKKVLEYANNAYKTAGLSANQYMDTVTSFSASLLKGLNGDTAKAADIANTAIVDMADNANKMGTSMESIQNAYQGFAKQNYTMLDNLKLGYGGTASEMARLINDSGVLGDTVKITAQDVNDVSFDKMIEAIHTVQVEMGMSGLTAEEAAEAVKNGSMTQEEAFEAMGTTAKEASTTIQGSIGLMKSAWENFLTGMADPDQDFDALLENLVDSVVTVADNLIPRIAETLPRLVQGISGVIETLGTYMPELLSKLLPALLEGAGQLLTQLVTGIPALFEAVVPALVESVKMILSSAMESSGIGSFLDDFLGEGTMGTYMETMTGIRDDMAEIFSPLLGKFEEIKTTFLENIGQIKEPVTTLFSDIMGSASDIWESVGRPIYEAIEYAIEWVLDRFNEALPTIITIVSDTFSLLSDLWNNVLKPAFNDIGIVIECLQPIFEVVFGVLASIFGTLVSAIGDLWNNSLKPIFSGIIEFLSGIFTGDFSKIIDGLVNIFKGLWSGIKTIVSAIVEVVSKVFGGLWDIVKTIFGGMFDTISGVFSKIFSTISSVIGTIASTISSVFGAIYDTISSIFTSISDTISSIWNGIWDTIKGVINSILGGIEGMVNGVIKGINKILGGIDTIVGGVGDLIGLDWSVPTLNEISLPRLAKGTVVDKPTIAQIGEDGTEAVVPLEKNREWIARVSEEMQIQGIGGDKETLSVLKEILALLKELKEDYSDMPHILIDAMVNGLKFRVNNREFARLVKAVN